MSEVPHRTELGRYLVDLLDEHLPPSKRPNAQRAIRLLVATVPDDTPETTLCRCGCGNQVEQTPGAKPKVWHKEACRSRYRRDRIRPDD